MKLYARLSDTGNLCHSPRADDRPWNSDPSSLPYARTPGYEIHPLREDKITADRKEGDGNGQASRGEERMLHHLRSVRCRHHPTGRDSRSIS